MIKKGIRPPKEGWREEGWRMFQTRKIYYRDIGMYAKLEHFQVVAKKLK